MPRFVVLLHECPEGRPRPTHWDLMLEVSGSLRTWALEGSPDSSDPVSAEMLGDHRIDYLHYAGPLSDGRGTVTPWDAGTFRFEQEDPDELVITLSGKKLNGIVTLTRIPDARQRWRFAFRIA